MLRAVVSVKEKSGLHHADCHCLLPLLFPQPFCLSSTPSPPFSLSCFSAPPLPSSSRCCPQARQETSKRPREAGTLAV